MRLNPKVSDTGDPIEVQGLLFADMTSALYDLASDPEQSTPIDAPDVIAKFQSYIIDNMIKMDAPPEAFERFGFPFPEKN